ncbi:AMP-binding protein [Thermodesulfobacteriota bacterium]
MGLYDFTIYDVISRNAKIYPDRDAVVFNQNRLTHKAYKEKCDQLAAGLVKAGIQKGDRLGVVANNNDEFMVLYGAAAKIGAIVLPVNWRFQKDEVAYVLNDCTPKIVFAGQGFQEMVADVSQQIKSIQKCYTIGPTEGIKDGFQPFGELYSEDGAANEFDIPADNGFVIVHTAAVGGYPRGALLSHGNVIASNLQVIDQNRMKEDECHICFLPLFHIAALSMVMAVMHKGGNNVILDRFDPELSLKLIEKEKVTVFGSFAPILKTLTEKYQEGNYDLSSLRYVGGLEDPDAIKAFLKISPNVVFSVGFGQTEAMGVTGCPLDEKPGSAGKPAIMSRVALFDDDDREVPVGKPGEICVRSPSVFLGYWGLEEETAFTFRNGWHHTGDMGRFDEEGYLWYVGRKAQKELIKPGGENVYPAEVENAILSHDAVEEASVIGVPDEKWGEAIKAICVLGQGKTVKEEELIEFVASKIARYKKPKFVVFVDALPKTEDGNIDRQQIKKDHGAKF